MKGCFPNWGGVRLGRSDYAIRLECLQGPPGLQGLSVHCFWKVEVIIIREEGCPGVGQGAGGRVGEKEVSYLGLLKPPDRSWNWMY